MRERIANYVQLARAVRSKGGHFIMMRRPHEIAVWLNHWGPCPTLDPAMLMASAGGAMASPSVCPTGPTASGRGSEAVEAEQPRPMMKLLKISEVRRSSTSETFT